MSARREFLLKAFYSFASYLGVFLLGMYAHGVNHGHIPKPYQWAWTGFFTLYFMLSTWSAHSKKQ